MLHFGPHDTPGRNRPRAARTVQRPASPTEYGVKLERTQLAGMLLLLGLLLLATLIRYWKVLFP